jgi:TonB family protein
MQCLSPIRATTVRSLGASVVLVAGLAASVMPSSRQVTPLPAPDHLESALRRVPVHTAEFAPIYRSAEAPTCEKTRLPEALLTPDPLMQDPGDELSVRVSFIIGPDGRVSSAFILHSGGRIQDRAVLRAVRRWRYRPAFCNGIPTPMEAQVSFVIR